jgi:HAD superfamily hydrolase (TIGR01549 family)
MTDHEGIISPNGTHTVLFDLDGTLRHNRPSADHTFYNIAAELGLPDSTEKRLRTMRWVHHYWAQSIEMLDDVEAFRGEDEAFWENYYQRHLLAFECDPEQAADLAKEIRRRMKEIYKPVDCVEPSTFELLRDLQEAGFRLGVVSNRTKNYLELLETLGLRHYFEIVIAAGEVGIWKPEPGIFEHALRKLGVPAEGTMYVGDNYYCDILGAQNAGLRPVLLDHEGIFPDASCDVLHSLKDLRQILKG